MHTLANAVPVDLWHTTPNHRPAEDPGGGVGSGSGPLPTLNRCPPVPPPKGDSGLKVKPPASSYGSPLTDPIPNKKMILDPKLELVLVPFLTHFFAPPKILQLPENEFIKIRAEWASKSFHCWNREREKGEERGNENFSSGSTKHPFQKPHSLCIYQSTKRTRTHWGKGPSMGLM
eukprot:EG_transcript_9349